MLFVLAPVFAQSKEPTAKTSMPVPQVLVLVWVGSGWNDIVSINYSSTLSDKQVNQDIKNLSEKTGWSVDDLKISTKKIPVPGASPSTSATFTTYTGLGGKQAVANIEPIVMTFKRYSLLQISYLVGEKLQLTAPEGFSDQSVDVAGSYDSGNLQYMVRVKNHDIERLDWPVLQADGSYAVPKKKSSFNFGLALTLACFGAVVAYFITKKLAKN